MFVCIRNTLTSLLSAYEKYNLVFLLFPKDIGEGEHDGVIFW